MATKPKLAWDDYLLTTTPKFPALSILDEACRCQVCKEIMIAPVITNCGHTFCSLCIRRCFTTDQRCPACRNLEEESRLRKNVAVEEIIEAFLLYRAQLMELDQLDFGVTPSLGSEVVEELYGGTNITSSDAVGNSVPLERTTAMPFDADLSDPEQFGLGSPHNKRQKRSAARDDSRVPNSVPCPICSVYMKEALVDAHLDKCLANVQVAPDSTPQSENSGNKVGNTYSLRSSRCSKKETLVPSPQPKSAQPSTVQKRLPKLNYSLLSESKLRKALADLGVPANGNKLMLQRRHTEWISLSNANMDAKRPKSRQQLMKELAAWDRVQTNISLKLSGDEIEDMVKGGKYQDQFGDLVAKARAGVKRKATSSFESNNELLEILE